MKQLIRQHIYLLIATLSFTACSVDKYVSDDEFFLQHVEVRSTDEKATKQYPLQDYIRQTPNTRLFGARVPLKVYCLSKPSSSSWISKTLRRIGEKPVICDSSKTEASIQDMVMVLNNAGYLDAEVRLDSAVKGRKLSLTYEVAPGTRYHIRSVSRQCEDSLLAQTICGNDTANSLLRPGMPFNLNTINDERSRITNLLRSTGYYKFNKDCISFTADSLVSDTSIDLTMHVRLHREDGRSLPTLHPRYRIGTIDYQCDGKFRSALLTSNTMFHTGEWFNEEKQRQTYNNFMRLQAVSYSNIRLQQNATSDTLNCQIVVNHARSKSLNFDLEGTNSAGDLGAAASASIQQRNLFHGSETFMLKLRGAYEAITGLEGYDGHNYVELGGEARLTFPGFLLPFVSWDYGATHFATSEISLQYNMQNRPEFNRRVLTAAWRYRWNGQHQKAQHKFDLLEINYVYMPWISQTFKHDYLDSIGQTNAILKYNYENILITKLGYTYSYNSLGTAATSTYGKNAYTYRFNIETSGNVLSGLASLMHTHYNNAGQREFCGIAYAQYARADFDFSKSIRIDNNNSVALHAALGVAVPYGNSSVLPFEKRYFAGGANSVRGWSVRSLGPGAYNGTDKGINFINQSGDIKLDLSLEYRSHLFWKINGAAFIDAGNIWTIRDYEDQPGGVFRFDEFYKQIAVSYGIGLRLSLDFFTIRFDAGMKAINPAYHGRDHYPIYHPNFGRDFAFHFAVGLPF